MILATLRSQVKQLNVTLRHLLGVAISSLTTPCASTAFGQHARPTYNLGQCDGLASFQVPVPPQLRPREVYGRPSLEIGQGEDNSLPWE